MEMAALPCPMILGSGRENAGLPDEKTPSDGMNPNSFHHRQIEIIIIYDQFVRPGEPLFPRRIDRAAYRPHVEAIARSSRPKQRSKRIFERVIEKDFDHAGRRVTASGPQGAPVTESASREVRPAPRADRRLLPPIA